MNQRKRKKVVIITLKTMWYQIFLILPAKKTRIPTTPLVKIMKIQGIHEEGCNKMETRAIMMMELTLMGMQLVRTQKRTQKTITKTKKRKRRRRLK